MARGTMKSIKRNRPEKSAKASPSEAAGGGEAGAISLGEELEDAGWLNCECLVSLILVVLLAALPFNLQANDFMSTRDSILQRAEELASMGHLDKALGLYDRLISIEETPYSHMRVAEVLAEASQHSRAIGHYKRAAALCTDAQAEEQVAAEASAGDLHLTLGRFAEAAASYEAALALHSAAFPAADGGASTSASPTAAPPQHAEGADALRASLASALVQDGRYEEALGHLEAPSGSAQLQRLHARTLRDMGDLGGAAQRYRRLCSRRSRDAAGLSALGRCLHEAGQPRQALQWYRKALAVSPAALDAQYAMHSVQGSLPASHRAPPAYVQSVFDDLHRRRRFIDSFAANASLPSEAEAARGAAIAAEQQFLQVYGLVFDGVAPRLAAMARRALGLSEGDGWHWLDVLDLGCGGGAAGAALEGVANRIVGVDASPAAVQRARETGAYAELLQADAAAALEAMPAGVADLVVAADVMPYFGDLSELLRAAARRLRPGGVLAFSVEGLDAAGGGAVRGAGRVAAAVAEGGGYGLRPSGRWAHSAAYVLELAAAQGLELLEQQAVAGQLRVALGEDGNFVKRDKAAALQATLYVMRRGRER